MPWSFFDEKTVKDGTPVLLSFTVENAAKIGYPPYKNSKQLPCHRCGKLMWVGPELQNKRDEGIYSLCEICVMQIHGPKAFDQMTALTNKGLGE